MSRSQSAGRYAVWFEGLVGDGQHDVPAGPRGRLGHESCAKHVLVFAALGRATLEVTERGDQESRLPHETLGSTIRGGTGLEHAERPALEVVHAVLTPLQLVVQPESLRDKTRPKTKRRLCSARVRRATGHSEKDFALGRREQRTRASQALAEPEDELTRRDEIGQHHCRRR